jgi:hypothetical protein
MNLAALTVQAIRVKLFVWRLLAERAVTRAVIRAVRWAMARLAPPAD